MRRAGSIYNLHKKGGLTGGVSAAALMPKSVSFLRKRKRSSVDSFCDCIPFFGGIAWYLSWVIKMAFLVRRRYDIFSIG